MSIPLNKLGQVFIVCGKKIALKHFSLFDRLYKRPIIDTSLLGAYGC